MGSALASQTISALRIQANGTAYSCRRLAVREWRHDPTPRGSPSRPDAKHLYAALYSANAIGGWTFRANGGLTPTPGGPLRPAFATPLGVAPGSRWRAPLRLEPRRDGSRRLDDQRERLADQHRRVALRGARQRTPTRSPARSTRAAISSSPLRELDGRASSRGGRCLDRRGKRHPERGPEHRLREIRFRLEPNPFGSRSPPTASSCSWRIPRTEPTAPSARSRSTRR